MSSVLTVYSAFVDRLLRAPKLSPEIYGAFRMLRLEIEETGAHNAA
jgi:hypothetical protein